MKRQYEDVEDVETAFIIQKVAKKSAVDEEESTVITKPEKLVKGRVTVKASAPKAKIVQQTIINPKAEAASSQQQTVQVQIQAPHTGQDDAIFDINSMPIVLSDDLLTPESIQSMPVVLSEDVLSQNAGKAQEKLLATLPKGIVSAIGQKHVRKCFAFFLS